MFLGYSLSHSFAIASPNSYQERKKNQYFINISINQYIPCFDKKKSILVRGRLCSQSYI